MLIKILASVLFLNMVCEATLLSADLPGDVQLGATMEIWDSNDKKCSSVDVESVRTYEVMKWTLNTLNKMDYVPGIKIGLSAIASCRVEGEALNAVISFVTRARKDSMDDQFSRVPIIGVIGPVFSSEAESTSRMISSLRPDDQLLQVVYSATASSLGDNTVYKNIRRVIPTDTTQVKAIVSFMKKLHWNYVAVIYDNNTYGRGGFDDLKHLVRSEGVCIAKSFPVTIGKRGEISFNEIKTIIRSLITHGESSITGLIVFGTSKTASSLLYALQSEKGNFDFRLTILFSEAIDLNQNVFKSGNSDIEVSKGSYNVVPMHVNVDQFISHWKSILTNHSYMLEEAETNPWLFDVLESLIKCRPSNDSSVTGCTFLTSQQADDIMTSSSQEYYTVLATLVHATVLQQIHNKTCRSSGVCNDLRDILYKAKGQFIKQTNMLNLESNTALEKHFPFFNISFQNQTVDAIQNENMPSYELYQFRKCVIPSTNGFCFEKIGHYRTDEAIVKTNILRDYHDTTEGKTWPDINKPQCAVGSVCTSCINDNLSNEVFLLEGDFYVVGIIPFHNKDSSNPLKCGTLREDVSMQIGLAMTNVLYRVNHEEKLFPKRKLGLLLLDSCNQALLCESKLINLLQGNTVLKNGTVIDISNKILGFIGSLSSSVSIACANVLSKFEYIQISYASTSAELSNRVKYPYFMRTPTPDDKQVSAILKIIQDLESNYVQIIYSEGVYGEGAYHALQTETKALHICVANSIKIQDGQYTKVVDLLRKYPFAKIVVIFVQSYMMEGILSAMYDRINEKEFIFIGSEAMGSRNSLLESRVKLDGIMSLSLKMKESIKFEDTPFDTLVDLQNKNPWLLSYLEKTNKCYFREGYDKSSQTLCPELKTLFNNSINEIELWTPFAINAMMALLSGTSQAFLKLCGPESTVLCHDFRTKPGVVYNYVKSQRLSTATNESMKVFDQNGDGNIGYVINQAQKKKSNTQIIQFVEVGVYRLSENGYQLHADVKKELLGFSMCPNDIACAKCAQKSPVASPINTTCSKPERDDVVLISLGSTTGVLTIVIAVLVCILCKLQRNHRAKEQRNTVYDVPDIDTELNQYLSVIHDGKIAG